MRDVSTLMLIYAKVESSEWRLYFIYLLLSFYLLLLLSFNLLLLLSLHLIYIVIVLNNVTARIVMAIFAYHPVTVTLM